jgi:hypothetical protein
MRTGASLLRSIVASPIMIAGDDALIATCNQAIALLERVRGWDDGTFRYPDDLAAGVDQARAWKLTIEAMSTEVTTLAGVRAQVALLLMHHECQGCNGPEHPEIELPPLRNMLRLLPSEADCKLVD